MNQPYQPGRDPYGQQYDVSYPPQTGYQPYGQQPGYGQQTYGPPPPEKSKLPIFIATGLVVSLAVGLALFFILRDPKATGGDTPSKAGPKEVAKAFFVAVDKMNEGDLKKYSRGDLRDDLDSIMSGEAQKSGLKFASGSAADSATKSVDEVSLATVTWELKDVPQSSTDDSYLLSLSMLDDGEGYRICTVSAASDNDTSTDADEALEDFANEYESTCDYSK